MVKFYSLMKIWTLGFCFYSLTLHPLAGVADQANHTVIPGGFEKSSNLPKHLEFPDHEDDFIIPLLNPLISISMGLIPIDSTRFPTHLFSLPPLVPPPKSF
jgi:hypothetical protein